jgi:hypothetical protein
MLRRLPPEKQLGRIEAIEAQAGTINKMLETIHYTAKLWSTEELDLEQVNVDTLVQDVCDRFSAEFLAK